MSDLKEKLIGYQIVNYLQSLKEKKDNADSAGNKIDLICEQIESLFSLSLESPDDFSSLSFFPVSLPEIFDAGTEALGCEVYATRAEKINQNPKFPVFVETVARRGYFDGCEQGSVEYLKRNAKVAAKFQAKVGAKASTPGKEEDSSAKSRREALAEEKKAAGLPSTLLLLF
jgi:hypothetical protein